VAGVVLSLGPDGIRPLYTALYSVVPGMPAIRATARFSVLTLAAIAVLAAMGVRALETRQRGAPLIGLAILVIGLEYSNGSIPFPPAPRMTTDAGAWIRQQPGSSASYTLQNQRHASGGQEKIRRRRLASYQ
jgi:hypothetical protein